MNFLDTITEVITSDIFSQNLIEINENFFNLKQESHIRNLILVQLNKTFKLSGLAYKAISEYPRINQTRVDLSIVDLNQPDKIFTIEFKFQLIGDYKNGLIPDRTKEIEYDLVQKNSDLFILIIVEWNDEQKLIFDNKYSLNTSLTRYNKGNNSNWEQSVKNLLIKFSAINNCPQEIIQIDYPYLTTYRFYFLQNPNKTSYGAPLMQNPEPIS